MTSALALHQTPAGDYITADGRSEATPERPIHPVVTVALADRSAQGPVHGFVYKAGSYADLSPDGTFGPVISRFTNEWEVNPTEFQVATSGFWPAEPGVLSTLETPTGYAQTFIAVPAQFKPVATTPEISGHERVWSSLKAELLRAAAPHAGPADWLPPSVLGYDLWTAGGKVAVSVDAHDSSGISQIVVLQLSATGMSTPAGGDHDFGNPGTPNGAGGRYEVTFDPRGVDPADISLMIQVVDGSGNVTTLTGKGDSIRLPFGLRNSGFEQGLKYWDITQPVAGNAAAVGPDPIPSIPGLTVRPFGGEKMLRLGVPKVANSHQVKGVTSASQQFISDGTEIVVAYRIITFDHRIQDVFVVDVKDTSGTSVGVWSNGIPTGSGSLPYKVSIELALDASFMDSGWTKMTIRGLPARKAFTISYSLNNDKDAALGTWIYVDRGD